MKKHRRELAIVRDVLSSCNNGRIITSVMRDCGISYKLFTKLSDELIQADLLKKLIAPDSMLDTRAPKSSVIAYRTTKDGKCFLNKLNKITELSTSSS